MGDQKGHSGRKRAACDNDGVTPAAGFAYDRLGRQATIDDAVGTREFAYNAYLQLDSEDLGTQIGDLYSKLFTREYWTSTHYGNDKSFQIGSSGTPAADDEVTYK